MSQHFSRTSVAAGALAGLLAVSSPGPAKELPGKADEANSVVRLSGSYTKEGWDVMFDAAYWKGGLCVNDGVTQVQGEHQNYLDLIPRYNAAVTFEDIVPLYTESSKPIVEGRLRKLIEPGLQARRNGMEAPREQAIYLTVHTLRGESEHLFLVINPLACVPVDPKKPSFVVVGMTREADTWKFDETLLQTPLFRSLSRGYWKQFGAPQDYARPGVKDVGDKASTRPATRPVER